MFTPTSLNNILFIIVFLVNLGISQTSISGTYVEYTGDVLPEDNDPAFTFFDLRSDARSVSNGILTINNTSSSGSIDHTRNDTLTNDDLAVFQFRARLTETRGNSPGTAEGGYFHAHWPQGRFLFFLEEDEINLKTIDTTTITTINRRLSFDTSEYHTYTIVKNRRESLSLFADGVFKLSLPFEELSNNSFIPAFQTFSGNPNATTDWDFVRYAIGDDALELISIPEPNTAFLAALAAIGISISRQYAPKW